MFYEVVPTKLAGAGGGVLTYSSEQDLKPGQIVEVQIRNLKSPAIVLKKLKTPPKFSTKKVLRIIENTPLPAHLLKALAWLSEYYLTPLPKVAGLILPVGVEKNRRSTQKAVNTPKPTEAQLKHSDIPLNPAQTKALESLNSLKTHTKLLHGITGSGKTNLYLKQAQTVIASGNSVILLVPEIALTSQLTQVFESTFGRRVVLLHSRQTEAERHNFWREILNEKGPLLIIGPRSALFAPVKNLGLIIIDESHESAYYQENTPKYSALRLASFIASTLKITCLQGSATPLVQDYYLAEHNEAVIKLTEKAKKTAKNPNLTLIDLKKRENLGKNRYFTPPLLKAIKRNLENHQQTLIFHNRRGSSPLTLCEKCGWQALCPACFLPLTLHTDTYQLVCHACGYQTKVPLSCPDCHHPNIIHKGFGTKLLETELNKLFKGVRISRFDADNSKEDSLDALYQEVKAGEIDILIGTQTLARGLDLPHLATVGIVQADAGLGLPDFAAEERTFHLLTQVIGRVGRGHLDTADAFIQTYQPDHPAITCALQADYDGFYQDLLGRRKKALLPPFAYLAKLAVTYKTEEIALKHIKEYYKILKKSFITSPPTPAFHERSTGGYTWELLIKSTSRKKLLAVLKTLPETPHLRLTLDPPSLL